MERKMIRKHMIKRPIINLKKKAELLFKEQNRELYKSCMIMFLTMTNVLDRPR